MIPRSISTIRQRPVSRRTGPPVRVALIGDVHPRAGTRSEQPTCALTRDDVASRTTPTALRREWDSNPRNSRSSGFQDRPVRPLRHPSISTLVLDDILRVPPVPARPRAGDGRWSRTMRCQRAASGASTTAGRSVSRRAPIIARSSADGSPASCPAAARPGATGDPSSVVRFRRSSDHLMRRWGRGRCSRQPPHFDAESDAWTCALGGRFVRCAGALRGARPPAGHRWPGPWG